MPPSAEFVDLNFILKSTNSVSRLRSINDLNGRSDSDVTEVENLYPTRLLPDDKSAAHFAS